jgi:hypothetical protein
VKRSVTAPTANEFNRPRQAPDLSEIRAALSQAPDARPAAVWFLQA